mmetsp:Transcript_10892/g.18430  ORF Transcript_10892/g.18430 Transcript_10892/m.18430 type:complete len:216 (-) Transcript_10892:1155-1802(-)
MRRAMLAWILLRQAMLPVVVMVELRVQLVVDSSRRQLPTCNPMPCKIDSRLTKRGCWKLPKSKGKSKWQNVLPKAVTAPIKVLIRTAREGPAMKKNPRRRDSVLVHSSLVSLRAFCKIPLLVVLSMKTTWVTSKASRRPWTSKRKKKTPPRRRPRMVAEPWEKMDNPLKKRQAEDDLPSLPRQQMLLHPLFRTSLLAMLPPRLWVKTTLTTFWVR